MARTYRVSKGQQYDRGGASVLGHDGLRGSYTADGRFHSGTMAREADRAIVGAAILRVIATGQPETVVFEEPEPEMAGAVNRDTCPRCGTYCYGDCQEG